MIAKEEAAVKFISPLALRPIRTSASSTALRDNRIGVELYDPCPVICPYIYYGPPDASVFRK